MSAAVRKQNSSAWYNEIDPFAAQWLRNLIKAGHIAAGEVDERSILDVRPSDLDGFGQCHFFAGIGVWSLALRLAGWDDERPVWTGSCPCQPFSAAGKGGGFDDERHLWPAFFHLISERRPNTVFGEQVASDDGLAWLDLVYDDMEGAGYACGAQDCCAASFGAPHIRQRLWWVACANVLDQSASRGFERVGIKSTYSKPVQTGAISCDVGNSELLRRDAGQSGDAGTAEGARRACRNVADRSSDIPGVGLVDSHVYDAAQISAGHDAFDRERQAFGRGAVEPARTGTGSGTSGGDHRARRRNIGASGSVASMARPGPLNGFWRDADWLRCRDGKWRPVEPGTFPLAHGIAGRVGRLRAYGNAISPQVASGFIEAVMAVIP